MAFKIASDRSFTRTVRTADGQDFEATFAILPDDELQTLLASEAEGEKAVLRGVVRRLAGVLDKDGKEMPGVTALEMILGFIDLRVAMMREYQKGRAEEKAGN